MKPMATEWVCKAEGDFAMLERECRARKNPNHDGACFHAQQYAEKYIKARLCEAARADHCEGVEPPRTLGQVVWYNWH